MKWSDKTFSARGLHKSYGGREVVRDVSLEVERGEVVGLLGPNGAGKTTCFYMMAGLVRADQGTITLGGNEITHWPIHVRALEGVGYLPQEASVFRNLSVEANIYAVLENRLLPRVEKRNSLESLIADFGLQKIRRSKGAELSGGERRRVEIARTLALGPSFILLDEPFAGVDPLAVNDIQGIIKGLKNQQIGVLITDHNVRETLGIVDRAYIMSAGGVLSSGTPEEIVNDEKTRAIYLGDSFRM